ncbi:hypothetical protein C7Y72_17875 [Paraconexibacter algicola]|uniref:Uncharacterized protein n=1 Tax=Paraconexibacter algicola TaxID=2133960 RepID=A0A2T4UDE1_9ACTN|nr:hypothetical protein C7Y72_17875 [Paraconexibacter algicola]
MIGAEFSGPDGSEFRVVASDMGAWIVQRVDAFEPVRRMSSAAIAAEFGTPVSDPNDTTDEASGWAALAAASDRAAARVRRVLRAREDDR